MKPRCRSFGCDPGVSQRRAARPAPAPKVRMAVGLTQSGVLAKRSPIRTYCLHFSEPGLTGCCSKVSNSALADGYLSSRFGEGGDGARPDWFARLVALGLCGHLRDGGDAGGEVPEVEVALDLSGHLREGGEASGHGCRPEPTLRSRSCYERRFIARGPIKSRRTDLVRLTGLGPILCPVWVASSSMWRDYGSRVLLVPISEHLSQTTPCSSRLPAIGLGDVDRPRRRHRRRAASTCADAPLAGPSTGRPRGTDDDS